MKPFLRIDFMELPGSKVEIKSWISQMDLDGYYMTRNQLKGVKILLEKFIAQLENNERFAK